MQEGLQCRRDKLFMFGLHMQPTVVVIGSLTAVESAYVVLDKTTWKNIHVKSLIINVKAVDICFKCFHVLHAAYPAETLAWLLLQKLVYSIHTKWDTKSATVAALLADLNVRD